MKGKRWNLGNGRRIKFRDDSWIMHNPFFEDLKSSSSMQKNERIYQGLKLETTRETMNELYLRM